MLIPFRFHKMNFKVQSAMNFYFIILIEYGHDMANVCIFILPFQLFQYSIIKAISLIISQLKRQKKSFGPLNANKSNTEWENPSCIQCIRNYLRHASRRTFFCYFPFFYFCFFLLQQAEDGNQHQWYKKMYNTIHKVHEGGECVYE